MGHPIGAVAVDIVFFPLNKVDDIRFLHPEGVNTHAFGHFLNVLKSHLAPLCYVLIDQRSVKRTEWP